MPICAFCQKEAVMTGEHLWSVWIGKLFPKGTYDFERESPSGQRTKWTLPNLGAKTKVVCQACNEGWMSRLEYERAKPALKEIIRDGHSSALLSGQVESIAAFAFKNAVIADHLNVRNEPFFTDGIRARFRKCLEIPPGVQMWSASYSGGRLRGIFEGYRFWTNIEAIADAEFYSFTYGIGYLVLQILASRWRRNLGRDQILPTLSPDTVWHPAAIQFWPHSTNQVSWPPEQDLSDESLKTFIERWKAPIKYGVG